MQFTTPRFPTIFVKASVADPARAVVESTSTSPLDSVGREMAGAQHAAASREAALLTSLGLVENMLGGSMILQLH